MHQILQMCGADGYAAFEERKRQTEEVGQLRILVAFVHGHALEHEGVGHEHGKPLTAAHLIVREWHFVQRIDHNLHLGGETAGNVCALLAVGTYAVQTVIDTFGPGHHLEVGDVGIHQLRGKGGLIVALEVVPVSGLVLNGVSEEEHLAAGGRGHGLHGTILQIGRLEDALGLASVEIVLGSRRARPHLCDVAVHTLQRCQAGFGRDNLPLRVIDQRMGGHIALDVHSLGLAVGFGIGEDLVQGVIVELVFQLVGQPGVLRRLVGWSPGKAVIFFPLLLEGLAVACPCPKLWLFHEDGVYARIDHALDVPFLDVIEIVFRRDNIRHHGAVPDGVAVLLHLSFVKMRLTVPLSGEVVLVFTPCNARHEMGDVAAFLPRTDSVLDGTSRRCARIATHAIHHHGIGPVVNGGPPRASGLEGGLHTVIGI